MLRALTPGLATLALAVAASPALGAWGAPESVTPEGAEGRMPAVAVGAAGNAALAWVHGSWRARAIAITVRGPGGRWDSPVRISPRGGIAIDPSVAVDASGRVLAVWRQTAGTQRLSIDGRVRTRTVWVVQARRRDADGIWGPIVTLSPRRLKVGAPALAVDAAGDAVVVWHWGTGTSPRLSGFVGQVQLATLDAGVWSPARRISGVGACREERRPDVAMGPAGHAVAWWQCDVRGGSTAFGVARLPGDSQWSPQRELPFRTAGDQNADLGVSADGTVVAISAARGGAVRWWRGTVARSGVSLASLPRSPAFEGSGGGGMAVSISVAQDADALSGWHGATGQVRVAPVAAALGAGAPVTLARTGTGVRIAAAADRRGVAAWVEPAGAGGRDAAVMASTRGGDGIWSQVRRISPISPVSRAASPRLAVTARGSALVAWQRRVDGRPVVERAEYTP